LPRQPQQSVAGGPPAPPYDSQSSSLIKLSDSYVLYIREVGKSACYPLPTGTSRNYVVIPCRYLALVALGKRTSFEKHGLIAYNFECFRKAILELQAPIAVGVPLESLRAAAQRAVMTQTLPRARSAGAPARTSAPSTAAVPAAAAAPATVPGAHSSQAPAAQSMPVPPPAPLVGDSGVSQLAPSALPVPASAGPPSTAVTSEAPAPASSAAQGPYDTSERRVRRHTGTHRGTTATTGRHRSSTHHSRRQASTNTAGPQLATSCPDSSVPVGELLAQSVIPSAALPGAMSSRFTPPSQPQLE